MKLARYQGNPNYVTDLRQKIGLYIGWVPMEYADQPTADNYYETLKNESTIAHAINLLSVMAAGERWSLECNDPVLQDILEKVLQNIEDFTHVRVSLIANSALFGLGLQYKTYEEVEWNGLPGVWQTPKRIREFDRRRLRIERNAENNNVCYWTAYSTQADRYVVLEDRAKEPKAEIALQDFIWFVYQWEELSPYFKGLGEVLYPLAFLKQKALQYWCDLCESWSKPFLVAKMDMLVSAINAELGAGFTQAADRAKEILETFEAARARHIAIIDSNDQLDFHEAGSTGNNIIRELIEYCDRKIQLLILGAELTTQTAESGGGSFALGQIHRNATQALIQYHRSRLAEVIKRDILMDFCVRNALNFFRAGVKFPDIQDIRLKFIVDTEEQEKQALAQKMQSKDSYAGGKEVETR